MQNITDSLIHLAYPAYCSNCGESLVRQETAICSICLYKLPRTRFEKEMNNDTAQLLWGRVPFEKATSFLYFRKGSMAQTLMHQFKYKGKKDIGIQLGRYFGQQLAEADWTIDIDFLVPVPLHWKKQKTRGFNQSEIIARGMEKATGIPVNTNLVKRMIENPSQTTKSRLERWENVEHIFEVKANLSMKGKHVVLVDDVITTGATLEACANKLIQSQGAKISFATLAIADD